MGSVRRVVLATAGAKIVPRARPRMALSENSLHATPARARASCRSRGAGSNVCTIAARIWQARAASAPAPRVAAGSPRGLARACPEV